MLLCLSIPDFYICFKQIYFSPAISGPVDNFWKDFHFFMPCFCKEIYNFTANLDNKV